MQKVTADFVASRSMLSYTQHTTFICLYGAHIYGGSIPTNGCPVHGSQAVLSPEVNMRSTRQQGHDALQVAITSTRYAQGRV